jgi:hypothetical protein
MEKIIQNFPNSKVATIAEKNQPALQFNKCICITYERTAKPANSQQYNNNLNPSQLNWYTLIYF